MSQLGDALVMGAQILVGVGVGVLMYVCAYALIDWWDRRQH